MKTNKLTPATTTDRISLPAIAGRVIIAEGMAHPESAPAAGLPTLGGCRIAPTLNEALADLGFTTEKAGLYRKNITSDGRILLADATAAETWAWLRAFNKSHSGVAQTDGRALTC